MAALALFAPEGIPTIGPGDTLAALIVAAFADDPLADGDILVLAQKILSKAEGRRVALNTVAVGADAKDAARQAAKDPRVMQLVLDETDTVMRLRPGVIIVRDRRGLVMANAGIDASNVEADTPSVLLLPEDPDASAARLKAELEQRTGRSLGIVIADSFGRAWRAGTTGTAIGAAGLATLVDLRGRPDRTGRPLETSDEAVADELAAAATLLMGQADEGRPVVRIRGWACDAPHGRAADLQRPVDMDLFP